LKKKTGRLSALIEEMRAAAAAITPGVFNRAELTVTKSQTINRLVLDVERCFALSDGIPNRNWFKHLVFGTRSTYAALLLPELTEAAEAGNDRAVGVAVAHLETALGRAISKLREVGRLMSSAGSK
jgi:hypothetical protein